MHGNYGLLILKSNKIINEGRYLKSVCKYKLR